MKKAKQTVEEIREKRRIYRKIEYAKNKLSENLRNKKWYEANKKSHRAVCRAWSQNNRKRERETQKAWLEKNPIRPEKSEASKVRKREYEKNRAKNCRALKAQYSSKYRASLVGATPSWADTERIMSVYYAAEILTTCLETPFEVDHVVPLKGKTVSGLHVHWNLRIITKTQNCQKSNKLIENIAIFSNI